MRSRKQRTANIARGITVLIIVVFVMGALVSTNPGALTTANITAVPTTPSIPTVVFPTVAPEGNKVAADYTYFQSSGLISLPHVAGWDLASGGGENAEEKIEAAPTVENATALPNTQISRVGVTFINGQLLSVIHAFAEKDPDRKVASVQDLGAYYDAKNLQAAWLNFKGGFKELNRTTSGDMYIINFELYLENNTYLGRQISRLNGDWLMVLRLVAPNNNPQLLDQLQEVVATRFDLWPQALQAPLTWSSVADPAEGYVVKYPPDWQQFAGTPGQSYTVNGTLPTGTVTLNTQVKHNESVKSEDEAKAWLKTNIPNGVLQTVESQMYGENPAFVVSYFDPDPDGNQRSAVVALINGVNKLYVVNLRSSARGQNLLDETNTAVPREFSQILNGIFLVPTDRLVPTIAPTMTPTPLPTLAALPTIAPQ
jgi:hypothetical protein